MGCRPSTARQSSRSTRCHRERELERARLRPISFWARQVYRESCQPFSSNININTDLGLPSLDEVLPDLLCTALTVLFGESSFSCQLIVQTDPFSLECLSGPCYGVISKLPLVFDCLPHYTYREDYLVSLPHWTTMLASTTNYFDHIGFQQWLPRQHRNNTFHLPCAVLSSNAERHQAELVDDGKPPARPKFLVRTGAELKEVTL
jgi:hypothetical protein